MVPCPISNMIKDKMSLLDSSIVFFLYTMLVFFNRLATKFDWRESKEKTHICFSAQVVYYYDDCSVTET